MSAVPVATPSSASPKPAPSSASPSGTTSAQGSISHGARRFHTYPNSSPLSAARPDRHRFCPSYRKARQVTDFTEAFFGGSTRLLGKTQSGHYGSIPKERH